MRFHTGGLALCLQRGGASSSHWGWGLRRAGRTARLPSSERVAGWMTTARGRAPVPELPCGSRDPSEVTRSPSSTSGGTAGCRTSAVTPTRSKGSVPHAVFHGMDKPSVLQTPPCPSGPLPGWQQDGTIPKPAQGEELRDGEAPAQLGSAAAAPSHFPSLQRGKGHDGNPCPCATALC